MTARLLVNLAALAANYQQLCVATQETGAVVKADAYGCGAVPVSQALWAQGCRHFFVATTAEALTLRQALPDATIYVFEGPNPASAAALASAAIVPVVNHAQQLDVWRAHQHLPIAVHVDTGMARLGFSATDMQPERFAGFQLTLLLTHFACADEPGHELNEQQVQRFTEVAARFPQVPVSLGNTAATLASGAGAALTTQGLARPGIGLYGGQAIAHGPNEMQVVATLQGQVLQTRAVATGQSVGYGATWQAQRESTIAVVGLGYADGLRRSLSNRGYGMLASTRVPIVGRISMDLVHLDVTDVPGAVATGDWVEFFGEQLPIGEVAALLQTIDYEVLTSIGPRVQREYRGSS